MTVVFSAVSYFLLLMFSEQPYVVIPILIAISVGVYKISLENIK